MTADELRRIALALPEVVEKSHFGTADFRVRDRIFASLPEVGRGVVKLTVEQQEVMCAAEPGMFRRIDNAWGRKGWTSVMLEGADEAALASALMAAWKNVAPAALARSLT